MLLRRRSSHAEIAAAKSEFEKSPEDLRVEIAEGISIVKKSIDGFYPTLKLADITLPLQKMGYEYLALELGTRIFGEYFDPVRSALSSRGVLPDCCRVEEYRLKNSIYRPFHGLCATNTPQGLTVRILLFGYLSYHVQFSRLQFRTAARHLYTRSSLRH